MTIDERLDAAGYTRAHLNEAIERLVVTEEQAIEILEDIAETHRDMQAMYNGM